MQMAIYCLKMFLLLLNFSQNVITVSVLAQKLKCLGIFRNEVCEIHTVADSKMKKKMKRKSIKCTY